MKYYESVIIMKPTLTEEETKNTINKYKENFSNFSDEVKVEDLGNKKLAYEIQGNKEGYYAVFYFSANSKDIADIERNYRTDDNIIKFLNVEMYEIKKSPKKDKEQEAER